MKFILKFLKRLFIALAAILLIAVILLYATDNQYIFRGIQLTYLKGNTTANINDRLDFDTRKIENGTIQLNEFGKIAADEWANTPNIRPNVSLGAYIIMPNHMHGILEITYKKSKASDVGKFKSPSQTIGAMVRGYKNATIKQIKEKIKSKDESMSKGSKGSKGELQFTPTTETPTEKIIELDYKIWQINYYEHIIRNRRQYTIGYEESLRL